MIRAHGLVRDVGAPLWHRTQDDGSVAGQSGSYRGMGETFSQHLFCLVPPLPPLPPQHLLHVLAVTEVSRGRHTSG